MDKPESSSNSLDEQVRRVKRRTVRYWFEDGLAELLIGGFFVLIGLYFATMGALPKDVTLLEAFFPAFIIALGLAGRRLIGRAKEGLVYPRTGYVSYVAPSSRLRWLTPALGAVIAALMVTLIRRAPALETWIPAMQGLLVSALLLVMNRSAQLGRLSFLAFVSSLTGLLLSIGSVSSETAAAIFFALVGLVMAGGGAMALRRYLRQAPPAEGA